MVTPGNFIFVVLPIVFKEEKLWSCGNVWEVLRGSGRPARLENCN